MTPNEDARERAIKKILEAVQEFFHATASPDEFRKCRVRLMYELLKTYNDLLPMRYYDVSAIVASVQAVTGTTVVFPLAPYSTQACAQASFKINEKIYWN